MSQLDRTIPPASGDIKMPNIPEYTFRQLPNGAKLYFMRGGSQPIIKVDIVFPAGTLRAKRTLVAKAAADLITEGTSKHSASELANKLDFYGAYLWGTMTLRRARFSLVALQRDLGPVIDIFREVIVDASYPEKEVALYIAQERQDFEISMLKTSFLANREIVKALHKEGSIYARQATLEDYDTLTASEIRDFHDECFRPEGASIFVSGRPSDGDIELIANTLGRDWNGGTSWTVPIPSLNETARTVMRNFDGEQTSVRFVRPLFSKLHPDFIPYLILDSALGGYFGSRLMQNLREKRGLTYGVNSYISSSLVWGLHAIGTEIRTGSQDVVVSEIKREIEELTKKPIPDKEMKELRGFILGDNLRSFDNAIATAETVSSLVLDGFTAQRVKEEYDIVKNITPSELLEVARRCFDAEAYSVVCVGRDVENN